MLYYMFIKFVVKKLLGNELYISRLGFKGLVMVYTVSNGALIRWLGYKVSAMIYSLRYKACPI